MNRATTSDLKPLNITRKINDIGNLCPGVGQEQTCDGIKTG